MGQDKGVHIWQMMTFLNPLDALIPKIPFSFFADFWVRVTSEAPGVSLGRIFGGPSIEPFWVEGGVLRSFSFLVVTACAACRAGLGSNNTRDSSHHTIRGGPVSRPPQFLGALWTAPPPPPP